MPIPKVLVFAGSIRTGSFNARLAAISAKEIARAEAEVTRISLLDFPLPLYDGDLEARSGPPENAVKRTRMFCPQKGVFVGSPDSTASLTPLLKNPTDGLSGGREKQEPPLSAYH